MTNAVHYMKRRLIEQIGIFIYPKGALFTNPMSINHLLCQQKLHNLFSPNVLVAKKIFCFTIFYIRFCRLSYQNIEIDLDYIKQNIEIDLDIYNYQVLELC